MEIQEVLNSRGITYLCHFTRAENLRSIFTYGLYSRSKLNNSGINFIYNDPYRFDGNENAVCTSIEFPNYKMFCTLQKNNPGTDWAVLGISTDVITKYKCYFCKTNAASAEMLKTSKRELEGAIALLKLFSNVPGKPNRNELNIPTWYPTNPQSEVLVFSDIPKDFIKCVVFNNITSLNKYKDDIPFGVQTKVQTQMFFGRCDYKYWQ